MRLLRQGVGHDHQAMRPAAGRGWFVVLRNQFLVNSGASPEWTQVDKSRKGRTLDAGAGVRAPFISIDRNA